MSTTNFLTSFGAAAPKYAAKQTIRRLSVAGPKRQDLTSVMEMFGAAVWEAQSLERGLRLLLVMIELERQEAGKARESTDLDAPDAPKTIGKLFAEVRLVEYLSDAEQRIISRGIRQRNFLVHSYWEGDRAKATITVRGRDWLVHELDHIRETCRKADRLVGKLIDQYLARRGTSLDVLSNSLILKWESEQDVPSDVLH